MRRGFLVGAGATVVGLALVVLGFLLIFVKGSGPSRTHVTLSVDVPATFYAADDGYPPRGGVVLAHGYSGDRATMSSLARSLARAGYDALALDLSGFGENPRGYGEGNHADEVVAAVEWLAGDENGPGGSVALLGHSMGGEAVLEAARRDERVDATVVLGASGSTAGISNVLVMFGERESAPAGAERIGGANHISVLWSDETVARTVAWLDETFEGEPRTVPVGIQDGRLAIAVAYFVAAALALPLLGLLAGRIVRRSRDEPPPAIRDVALVGIALAVGVPGGGLVDPAEALGAGYGDVVSALVVAGVILYLPRLRRRPPVADHPLDWVYRAAAGSAVAVLGAFVLFAPLDGVVHRLFPTSGRLILAAIMAPLLAVFFVQLQALLRRGPWWRATAAGIAGHAAVLAALGAGVVVGVFPDVVVLALPLLAGLFALVELFALGAYYKTRSGAFVGIVEASWIAGVVAVAMPLPS